MVPRSHPLTLAHHGEGACHILKARPGRVALAVTEHATDFKRMNNHFVKVLPFKMANVKPPIPVLKKKIYLLEGFPRNTSQQLETDSEVFVVLHEFV